MHACIQQSSQQCNRNAIRTPSWSCYYFGPGYCHQYKSPLSNARSSVARLTTPANLSCCWTSKIMKFPAFMFAGTELNPSLLLNLVTLIIHKPPLSLRLRDTILVENHPPTSAICDHQGAIAGQTDGNSLISGPIHECIVDWRLRLHLT